MGARPMASAIGRQPWQWAFRVSAKAPEHHYEALVHQCDHHRPSGRGARTLLFDQMLEENPHFLRVGEVEHEWLAHPVKELRATGVCDLDLAAGDNESPVALRFARFL